MAALLRSERAALGRVRSGQMQIQVQDQQADDPEDASESNQDAFWTRVTRREGVVD